MDLTRRCWCCECIESSWRSWWRPKSIKEISLLLWLCRRLLLWLLGWSTKCCKTRLWLLLDRLWRWWSKWVKGILNRSGWLCSKRIERSKVTLLGRWSKLTYEWKSDFWRYKGVNWPALLNHSLWLWPCLCTTMILNTIQNRNTVCNLFICDWTK